MPLIHFRKEFRDLIRQGKKTQTIRIWKRRCVKVGDICTCPHLGEVKVTAVSHIMLNRLTSADAKREGFRTRKELIEKVKKIYRLRSVDNIHCWRIQFKYLPKTSITASKQRRLINPF